jgi:hypothetical protein
VVDEDGFEGTDQSAESAGGGLTIMLQVQVLLGESDLFEAGFAGLLFLGGRAFSADLISAASATCRFVTLPNRRQ